MDPSKNYVSLAQRLFGRTAWSVQDGSDSEASQITATERKLLELIPIVYPSSADMPPGSVPNPSKKKVRPSSASANVQSHPSHNPGLYDNDRTRRSRPITASPAQSHGRGDLPPRPKTHAGGPRFWGRPQQQTEAQDDRLQQRRLTISVVDGIGISDSANKAAAIQGVRPRLFKGKIEEEISIDTLEELKQAFQAADVAQSGKLELAEFKALLKGQLHIPNARVSQIDALFQKIDWSSEGAISWDEFCTYMQLEYAEKEDSYLRSKEIAFQLPAKIKSMPHRDPVLRITDTSDGVFMACSQDGLVTFWSSSMTLKRSRSIVTPEMSSRLKPKWVTDFTIMPHYNKIIIGTGDREIQFYELSSFEPYCQISSLETVPLKLDYCSTGHDECLVLYGDSQGCINILVIQCAGECLRTWKKAPKADGIASIAIDAIGNAPNTRFIRWKVHGDWVQQVKYYHEIRQVISSSNDANTALVIGCTTGSTHVEQQLKEIRDPLSTHDRNKQKRDVSWLQAKSRLHTDQSVFKVYKGVKSFDFSKDKNILVTGGMDRIVRLWNPYVPLKPTGMLRGHNAPIFYLFIAEEENRIFSISTDKCVRVWDIQDQNCLLVVRPKGHKIRGDLQACHYSNVTKTLALATDQMNGLPLRLKPLLHADIPITHKEPIHAVVYNPAFKQVITCSDDSTIKLWDYETGSAIFEFGEAHGDAAITSMTLDATGRRLITGGRDGCIRIWNYNNGHCLRTMMKEKDVAEVCALTYVEMNRNRYVVAVGWDKRINIFSDSTDASIHHVIHPQPKWTDDLIDGHKEDILSVAQSPPNLLATSSYDGEVIVWNMVSGHIFCHLCAPLPPGFENSAKDGEVSISKIVFLKSRASKKEAASLIASGPCGYIHVWNVFQGGSLYAQFLGSKMTGAIVSAMEINKDDTLLFTGDNFGFIYAWNVSGYGAEHPEPDCPELVTTWRGHVESVTCMTIAHEQKMLLTASLDCTTRMWTFDGEYVGTFGQPDSWDIYNISSYQHPMVPYDVLVDPLSLPDHPVIEGKRNTHQVIHEDSARNSIDEGEEATLAAALQYGKQMPYIDDGQISDMLKERSFHYGKGKRLRHQKLRPNRIDRGGPSEYQMLRCFALEATPQPGSPKHLRKHGVDPFDFYGDDVVEVD